MAEMGEVNKNRVRDARSRKRGYIEDAKRKKGKINFPLKM